MARKRQDPPLGEISSKGIWKGHITTDFAHVPAELHFAGLIVALGNLISRDLLKAGYKPGPDWPETYRRISDIAFESMDLFQEILTEEAERALTTALNEAAYKTLKRADAEAESRNLYRIYPPPVKPGRKPGSKQSPEVTARKVQHWIERLHDAERYLENQKTANWSLAVLAKAMKEKPQTLGAAGKKYPQIRQKVEEILQRHNDKN